MCLQVTFLLNNDLIGSLKAVTDYAWVNDDAYTISETGKWVKIPLDFIKFGTYFTLENGVVKLPQNGVYAIDLNLTICNAEQNDNAYHDFGLMFGNDIIAHTIHNKPHTGTGYYDGVSINAIRLIPGGTTICPAIFTLSHIIVKYTSITISKIGNY